MSFCNRLYRELRIIKEHSNTVEKFLLAFLLLVFLYPLTLPNTYNWGYKEIDPPELLCSYYLLNDDTHTDPNETRQLLEVDHGGRYRNVHCDSQFKQRVAIIVPYRNRSEHLKIFLKHMHKFLIQQNQIDYQIFVIEQDDNHAFNRANLFNIGYRESLLIDPNIDCFIFHDVDILPLNLEQQYVCTESPKHLCSYLDKFRFVLIYPNLFGGAITINAQQFQLVNGYSNRYSGWGGEDDDFYQRVQHKFHQIERYPPNVARCTMIKHGKYEANSDRNELLKNVLQRSSNDGLSNLNQTYLLKQIEYFPLYVKIKVTLKV